RLQLGRVRLVVLSACGSEGARFGRAASNGLAEAFLDAGVGNVIASEWEADDSAAALLTTNLHRGLRSGIDAAEALRRAQVDLLKVGGRMAAPAMWAGFRLTGGTR